MHEAKKNFLHNRDLTTDRRSNNRIMMNFRFPVEFKYTIKRMARQDNVSMTELLMRALEHYGQQRQVGREL